eukprot:6935160-Pyramimonas_sp.AAC.1
MRTQPQATSTGEPARQVLQTPPATSTVEAAYPTPRRKGQPGQGMEGSHQAKTLLECEKVLVDEPRSGPLGHLLQHL